MISFALACGRCGHSFDAWFRSGADWEAQSSRGLVECPACGSAATSKAPMAPAVHARAEPKARSDAPGARGQVPPMVRAALAGLARRSEDVGSRLYETARAIRDGRQAARPVRGEATRAELEALLDEGFPVLPLPDGLLDG